ncbi:transcription factor bHLH130-like [Impatiens glandulifera]|uniref:transcription factor bHLH130-like n=1 Tax=Impatiens glandulifera TaxID=253017 RepID=UPI001FB06363|nr:transcription factor bHLH130-like [Impatiens glandulifera]
MILIRRTPNSDMYGVGCSQTILRDSSHQFSAAFTKNGDSSNRHQDQPSSGLMRYRSAPSSFFASLLDSSGGVEACCEDFLNSNESDDAMFTGFMVTDSSASVSDSLKLQFPVDVKNETAISKPPLPLQNGYSKIGSRKTTSRQNSGNSTISKVKSNLVRQSSSPAGIFSNLSVENGFALMKDMRSTSFSSGLSSSSRFMPQIAENGNEDSCPSITENEQMGNDDHDKNSYYIPGRLDDAWDNSTTSLTGIKRSRDDDLEKFSGSYSPLNQHDDEARKYSTSLTHHLSLPKTYAEMAVVEKFLHFQHDSVPCKIRAKRGCATHPRSIAERMRRTRISERMRKLQELFPNMDKQTNTADMLELAVGYIKDLQKQVQTLTEIRERCSCCVGEKSVYN